MADYDNTNTGALFVNDKKQTDTHPDRTGSINIDGVEYWLNGWIKTSKSGAQFLSLSVKPKQAQSAPMPAAKPARPTANVTPADYDDPIPF